ncbi:MAG: GAF domain-containing protein [Acidobacteriota bacterium]|nr:GAF domain-containing protein [Acidobacteriota bacterium]
MSEETFGYEEFSQNADATDAGPFAIQLREVIDAIDVSDSLTTPLLHAIDDLLQLAAKTVGSKEASVLVRDGSEGGLRFLTAISDVKEALLKLRLPPGKGIAGLVFSTGQPMAVSDVSTEGSFWSEADKKTGFKTITLLATPLRTGNEMVGVLEFVNRVGEPPYPPFTPEEMDHAAYFADAIARLVDAHEIAELVESIFDRSIKTVISGTEGSEESVDELREWVNSIVAAPEHRDMGMLWISLREIFSKGEAERELCRDLLQTFARFTEKRSAANASYSGF